MLSSRNRDGSTPSRLAEVPQRGVVAAQSANIGVAISHNVCLLAMCDSLARFGWTAMVTRIGTLTETVARLSEVLKKSCELISFLAAML